MLTREQKQEIVEKLVQDLKEAKGAVFSEFQKLPSRDVQTLRSKLRQEQVTYKVVKISLLKRALNRAGFDPGKFDYHMPMSVSISQEDEVIAAKIISEFAKGHENLKVLSGILDKKLIGADRVKQLAALPGKQELRGQVVFAVASPLRGLVGVLSGNLRGLLNVFNAIKSLKVS